MLTNNELWSAFILALGLGLLQAQRIRHLQEDLEMEKDIWNASRRYYESRIEYMKKYLEDIYQDKV